MTAPVAKPVDVLAVMDEAALTQCIRSDREDMREARVAVTALIEADEEYDEAAAAVRECPAPLSVNNESGRAKAAARNEAKARLRVAAERRRAALARVQGGQP